MLLKNYGIQGEGHIEHEQAGQLTQGPGVGAPPPPTPPKMLVIAFIPKIFPTNCTSQKATKTIMKPISAVVIVPFASAKAFGSPRDSMYL